MCVSQNCMHIYKLFFLFSVMEYYQKEEIIENFVHVIYVHCTSTTALHSINCPYKSNCEEFKRI